MTTSPEPSSKVADTRHKDKSIHWVDLLHGPATAWLILVTSLLITLFAWKISDDYADRRARERFEFQVNEAENAINKRFVNYEQVLRGGLGLFKASQNVSRREWHIYVTTLEIDRFFPGTLGVGYALWLDRDKVTSHIEDIRSEGFADYTVRPAGDRDQYSAIIYLEPFNKRNQRAFGFDMYSEPTRQKAMARARDTGKTALSGKVTLVQEMSTDVQAGFLVYVPHYSREVDTPEQRRESLVGFVYSALRIGDLMEGILGVGLPELDFVIYDGTTVNPSSLLYDSVSINKSGRDLEQHQFEVTRNIDIAGHTWTVRFQSNQTFDQLTKTSQPTIVAASGLIIDFLLFNVILSLARLRKRAQQLADQRKEKLSEREVQFKSITDSANDGIISTDENRLITYFNQSAQTIFGYPTEQVLHQSIDMLFPENSKDQITEIIAENNQHGGASEINQPVEIEGLNINKQAFPLELSLAGWRIGDRKNYTLIVRDITERKRVDRMKSEFISTVSHELRTPLTAIGGSLALIENGVTGDIDPQTMELVKTAHRNAKRLTNLVNDLLDTEKLASGKMRFNYEHCDLPGLLDHAIEINRPVATHADIDLEVTKIDPGTVYVDPQRFDQVMTNLLANAIKFSSAGNKVEVSAEHHDDKVRIAVRDNGVGVPEEFHTQIFNKFEQADSSDSRKYGGTGLGLSIVKFIVEKFNGTVGFRSVPGRETVFYFDIPMAASKE